MNPIITDALTTTGEMTRTVAANLRRQNYTTSWDGIKPDDAYAMSLLAFAMVDDETGIAAQNDHYMAYERDYPRELRAAARQRLNRRHELADALTDLSRDERIRLIDALADGLSTVAA